MTSSIRVATKALPPLVKWAGGKTWLAAMLADLYDFSGCDAICEPFAGGMALSLYVRPRYAYINDLNSHLINLYHQIRFGFLREKAEWWFCDKEHYYNIRDRFNELIQTGKQGTEEAAQCFWYINKYGFNGLCRFNRKGLCNTPWGGVRAPSVPNLKPYRTAFSQWQFSTVDFRRLLIHKNTFVYCDPPYEESFSSYNGTQWTTEDLVELVEWSTSLSVPVVISNLATDFTLNLFRSHDFKIDFVDGPRRISRDGNREPAKEVVARYGF